MNAVAPTDINWFNYFRNSVDCSEVNFWTPTPWNLRRLKKGDKFYFLLKSPIRKIAGVGIYDIYLNLSARETWNKYGSKTGCHSFAELISRISGYINKNSIKRNEGIINPENYIIGNVILKECEFWEADNYISINIKPQVVKIKYIDNILLKNEENIEKDFQLLNESRAKINVTTSGRVGQSNFSSKIFKAYKYKCCISNDECTEILHAGHIQGYINKNSHHIQNGLLLRVDFHKLYDSDLIYIDPSYKVHVSELIKSPYYRSFHGKRINLPEKESQWPSKIALESRRHAFRKN